MGSNLGKEENMNKNTWKDFILRDVHGGGLKE